ncbi:MAG: serine hydroxymethyltransferase [Rhizobiales bacterium]|nr:serine hydroxymethyltransferase [Hyphomicrobiales bacterium]
MTKDQTSAPEQREVLFEFTIIGSAVRVAAIDAVTGLEVTVMGPANAARADLVQLATNKLKSRLAAVTDR